MCWDSRASNQALGKLKLFCMLLLSFFKWRATPTKGRQWQLELLNFLRTTFYQILHKALLGGEGDLYLFKWRFMSLYIRVMIVEYWIFIQFKLLNEGADMLNMIIFYLLLNLAGCDNIRSLSSYSTNSWWYVQKLKEIKFVMLISLDYILCKITFYRISKGTLLCKYIFQVEVLCKWNEVKKKN